MLLSHNQCFGFLENLGLGEEGGGMGCGGRPRAFLPLPLHLLFFGAFQAEDLAKDALSRGLDLESD